MFMRSARLLVTLIGSLVAVGCTQPSSVQCPGGLVCPPGTTCAAHQSVCIKGLCGNGTIDTAAGEACDDGNIVDGDGCSADCKSNESCGNGIVDKAKGEVCDKGADNASCSGCSADCKSDETCGNGVVDTCKGEVCDDGNNVSGDGCAADCKSTERCGNSVVDVVDGEVCDKGADNNKCMGCSPDCKSNQTCGNGIVDACKGEVCDDGNNIDGDGCSANCKSNETCGNGIVDIVKGEVCDDGNTVSGDGCSADCKSEEKCGNGTVDKGEECDPGTDLTAPCGAGIDCPAETATCNRDCTVAFCGDGKINRARHEECDDGVETAHCNANCTLAVCGDGILNVVAGEQCDAGNGMSPGACTASCTNALNCMTKTCTSTSCTSSCTATADIANCNGNGAGAAKCKTSACGDGHTNTAAGETCDTLGGADTNGCNGKNAGAVACHGAVCGDGYVNTAAGEECDTLGGADTQTCNGNSAGAVSAGVACKLSHCGDGYKNAAAGETCDPPGANGADTNGCNGKTAGAVACKVPSCGDGYKNAAAGETCDTLGGGDTASCNGNSAAAVTAGVACKAPSCGDSYANGPAGEACDNGPNDSANCNGNSAAAVNAGVACKAARCGDGYQNAAASSPPGGEACDNGSSNSNTGLCLTTCVKARCGDGYIEAGVETCDPGSPLMGSGCSTCTAPDSGWTCTQLPSGASTCAPVCGDGVVINTAANSSLDELCDDHNVNSCGLCNNPTGCTNGAGATAITTVLHATGTIKSTSNNGGYKANQVFTISDGAHSVTFEFDGGKGVGAGNVPIDISNSTNTNGMACRICQAVSGSGLNISATGSCFNSSSVCTNPNNNQTVILTNLTPGGVGSVPIITRVTQGATINGMTTVHGQDCATGVGCTSNEDCASDVCSLPPTCVGNCNTCVAPSCGDGKQNGLETATDCGGGTCAGCATGQRCIANSDCADGVCSSTVTVPDNKGICAAPTCKDKVLNGNETDVDCGGIDCDTGCGTNPATCFQCAPGQGCQINLDCAPPTGTPTTTNGLCDSAGTHQCVPAELLQVVVSGGATLASAPSGVLQTGDISGCTSTGGGCVQSYAANASVTLTATSPNAGAVSWKVNGTSVPTCACPSVAAGGTCACTVTMSSSNSVAVTTP
jgi:cysteine-rich repeat protein